MFGDMWTQPSIVSSSLIGKSKWKMKQQSLHFILQQDTSKDNGVYRIVTRSFPTYIGKPICIYFLTSQLQRVKMCLRCLNIFDTYMRNS
ncbi:hypothetical protein DSO57_1010631 [Entomophthora muscae]|uniref:Uncharacterized protein n=1 Tax=Entomophthora muscae TaxID=34485 RepID=A0ACC2S8U3_9FUNG|nr:hypothetical protein DSO57_1010631 [Entomophthora muscae]